MNDIISLGKELSAIRKDIEATQTLLEAQKNEKERIQGSMIAALKEGGLKSVKTLDHNYALVTKNQPVITDEAQLYVDLEKRNMLSELMAPPKLDKTKFNSFALSLMKETGEIPMGCEMTTTEYISITSTKKAEPIT